MSFPDRGEGSCLCHKTSGDTTYRQSTTVFFSHVLRIVSTEQTTTVTGLSAEARWRRNVNTCRKLSLFILSVKALPQFHALCLGKTTASFLSFNSVEQCVQWDCGRDGEAGESEGARARRALRTVATCPSLAYLIKSGVCVCARERER